MSHVIEIFREELVSRGMHKSEIWRYVAYQSRLGGYLVYDPGSGSPKKRNRVTPDPETLDAAWKLLERGYRMRLQTKDGVTGVFSIDTGIKANWR